jgi:uracil-DNA glycosylase
VQRIVLIALPGVGTHRLNGGRPLSGRTGAIFAELAGVGDHATDLWPYFEIISLTPRSVGKVPKTHPDAGEIYRQGALAIRERMKLEPPRTVLFMGQHVYRAFHMPGLKIIYFQWATWLGKHQVARIPSPHYWGKWIDQYPGIRQEYRRFLRKAIRDAKQQDAN